MNLDALRRVNAINAGTVKPSRGEKEVLNYIQRLRDKAVPTVTIEWKVEDTEYGVYRFPSAKVGELNWHAHHSVGDRTDQIDGYFETENGRLSLDLWCIDGDGTDDLRSECPEVLEPARKAWAEGAVFAFEYGVMALLVPGKVFTEELLAEALRRAMP